ncbi:conserved hypothetical protein [Ricinus communis]|uniref:Uncharacterized protein n=1 Tax=Ricinus communis TaxID=3988 RepID=B9RVN6_RICCO|nr:conserved hypothetical protein [Ricinus communis]
MKKKKLINNICWASNPLCKKKNQIQYVKTYIAIIVRSRVELLKTEARVAKAKAVRVEKMKAFIHYRQSPIGRGNEGGEGKGFVAIVNRRLADAMS